MTNREIHYYLKIIRSKCIEILLSAMGTDSI